MKKKSTILMIAGSILLSAIILSVSCKTIARAAARYWTKREIKEFVSKCEDKTGILLGQENAKKYCDCAVDVVAEKYRNYEDVKKISLTDVLKVANDCK